ncbi:MAG: 7-carboxy-7-deazaguanine synthase QueE [Candidatus Gastranaerophilales bacterium]|nr:7-carboxy-7-deazaguanine synthase QueE [Candidatus Gastranaerophilales bacterium]
MTNAFIKEVFESIQGEALYIGQKQLFIRFCGCNLNCDYCDTDFKKDENFVVHDLNKIYTNPVTPLILKEICDNYNSEMISLTGGEPLLYKEFLKEFLPLINNKKIYLETNGTLTNELEEIIDYVDVVSTDIKLSCSTKQDNRFEDNEEFIKIVKEHNKEIFAKIILDKNYDKDEILKAIEILKKHDVTLIIQPMDCKAKENELKKQDIIDLFDFVTNNYPNSRLIPQVHKFLNLL